MIELDELNHRAPNTHKDPNFQHLSDEQYQTAVQQAKKIRALLAKVKFNENTRNH
jgi:hypothetical protein